MKKSSILLVSVIIGLLGIVSFVNSPYFQIRKLEINGLNMLNKEHILNYLNDYKNTNIITFDEDKVKKRLKTQEKYIKEVNIIKNYPDKLLFEFEERKPVGQIINDGIVLVFDKNGYILENNKNDLKAEVPTFKGFGYYFQSEKLEFTGPFSRIVTKLAHMDYSLITKINLIKYKEMDTKPSNIKIKTTHGTEVLLGQLENLDKKFKILSVSLQKIINEQLVVDYINLKYPEKPVYKLKNKK